MSNRVARLFSRSFNRTLRSAPASSRRRLAIESLEDRRTPAVGAGSLDSTFDFDGIATAAIGNMTEVNAVAQDSSGRIVAAGSTFNGANWDMMAARFNADGSLDSTFGIGGIASFDFFGATEKANALTIDAAGRILLVGSTNYDDPFKDFALVRFTSTGSLDTSFSGDGWEFDDMNSGGRENVATSVKLDGLGQIVVGGYTNSTAGNRFTVARYFDSGTRDNLFGSMGVATINMGLGEGSARALLIDGLDNIVVVGEAYTGDDYDFGAARLTSNGMLDTSFGVNGTFTKAIGWGNDIATSAAWDSSGRIVIGGYGLGASGNDFAAVTLETNAVTLEAKPVFISE